MGRVVLGYAFQAILESLAQREASERLDQGQRFKPDQFSAKQCLPLNPNWSWRQESNPRPADYKSEV